MGERHDEGGAALGGAGCDGDPDRALAEPDVVGDDDARALQGGLRAAGLVFSERQGEIEVAGHGEPGEHVAHARSEPVVGVRAVLHHAVIGVADVERVARHDPEQVPARLGTGGHADLARGGSADPPKHPLEAHRDVRLKLHLPLVAFGAVDETDAAVGVDHRVGR